MGRWELLAGAAIIAVVASAVRVVLHDAAASASVRAAARRPLTWIIGVPAVLLVLLVGAPFVYVQSIATTVPKPLSFADLAPPSASVLASGPTASADTTTTAVTGAAGTTSASSANTRGGTPPSTVATTAAAAGPSVVGAWAVGKGSQARYHVNDNVMGQTSEVVGSTPDVSGAMAIVGSSVTTARVVVNMQTVTCNCVHDSKYRDLLDTDVYPTSMFELTQPIPLASIPPDGEVVNVPVRGNFTIHGVTRDVSFTLDALRQGGRIAVHAKVPVRLEDYKIDNPSNSFGSLSDSVLEFLVAFDRTG
jgi:polyisoprenoid-binding protein YceI